jgi:hypothetical protein
MYGVPLLIWRNRCGAIVSSPSIIESESNAVKKRRDSRVLGIRNAGEFPRQHGRDISTWSKVTAQIEMCLDG